MIEADLVKIRTALDKETLVEACEAMEAILKELGYRSDKEMPVLGDDEINTAFEEAFAKPIYLAHKPTPEEILLIRLKAIAKAQRDLDEKNR